MWKKSKELYNNQSHIIEALGSIRSIIASYPDSYPAMETMRIFRTLIMSQDEKQKEILSKIIAEVAYKYAEAIKKLLSPKPTNYLNYVSRKRRSTRETSLHKWRQNAISTVIAT